MPQRCARTVLLGRLWEVKMRVSTVWRPWVCTKAHVVVAFLEIRAQKKCFEVFHGKVRGAHDPLIRLAFTTLALMARLPCGLARTFCNKGRVNFC